MNGFAALAEPRRKEIMCLLAESGEMTASQICQSFDISAPAVSQHLKILRENQLVTVKKMLKEDSML